MIFRQHWLEAATQLSLLCLDTPCTKVSPKTKQKNVSKEQSDNFKGFSVQCAASASIGMRHLRKTWCIFLCSFIPACTEVSTKTNKKKFQKKNQIILKVFSFIVRRQRQLVCGVYGRRDASIACVAASVPPPPSPPPPPLTPLTHGARQVGSTQKDHPRDQFTVGLHPATGRF